LQLVFKRKVKILIDKNHYNNHNLFQINSYNILLIMHLNRIHYFISNKYDVIHIVLKTIVSLLDH